MPFQRPKLESKSKNVLSVQKKKKNGLTLKEMQKLENRIEIL